jgi:methyl-accepting chemotaxis protein
MDGNILKANDNFLKTLGYTLDEVRGSHHSIFVPDDMKKTAAYKEFWANLNKGQFQSGQFCRKTKDGKLVWIEASYNPLFDVRGRPYKVVKFATDITQQKVKDSDYQGQIDAINKSQAVIEFNMDGTIINANSNFLSAMGYQLGDIQNKHHSIFVEPSYAASAEYKNFWEKLNKGEYRPGNTNVSAKAGKRSGSKPATTPF